MKIVKIKIASFALLLFMLTGCKQYYLIEDFERVTKNHKTIAILPFEIMMTGYVPPELTQEDIDKIEVIESEAFQASFFHQVLESRKNPKRRVQIDVQHYNKTLDILKENNISIKESWKRDPAELASILGVDGVMKARVEKDKYFSDGASAGIEAGMRIIDVIARSRGAANPVPLSSTNKRILTKYSLINQENGQVLWSYTSGNAGSWRSRENDMVNAINYNSSRRFPYRKKNKLGKWLAMD